MEAQHLFFLFFLFLMASHQSISFCTAADDAADHVHVCRIENKISLGCIRESIIFCGWFNGSTQS